MTGLAFIGEGGRVLAQEGPGSCRDGFGQRRVQLGPNERLVGFKFYSDHCTPKISFIIADMGTYQGGAAGGGGDGGGVAPATQAGGGGAGVSAYELAGCWLAWGLCCGVLPVLGAIVCHSPRSADHYHACGLVGILPLTSTHWQRAAGNTWHAFEGGPDDRPGNPVGCNVKRVVNPDGTICETSDCCFNGCLCKMG